MCAMASSYFFSAKKIEALRISSATPAPKAGAFVRVSATSRMESFAFCCNISKRTRAESGWPVFANELRHSDSYPRGARDGSPIFHTDYARWWVVDSFNSLGAEFMKSVGL